MNIIIREEQVEEYPVTEEVVRLAFENAEHTNQKEHELVTRLRQSSAFIPQLSLIAVNEDTQIVGHILLSKIEIVNKKKKVVSLALAPVSVLPAQQRKGIGRQLIMEALKKGKELGYQSVIVLGDPAYYYKFGFKSTSNWGIRAPFEVPDEVFMALEINDGALDEVSGIVQYPRPFLE